MRETKFRALGLDDKMYDNAIEIGVDKDDVAYLIARLPKTCGIKRFLEWTGLHDKNGKEIYEGDIIDWRGQHSEDAPQPVIWYYTGWYVGYTGKQMSITSLNAIEPKKMEVIGNIYENPELLEK